MVGNPIPGKKSVFSHGQTAAPDPGIRDEMVNIDRRLRVLEEGLTNMRRRFQVTEQNMLSKNRHFSTEIKTINSEINELKKEIMEIKERMLMMIKELQECAKKEEVKVLEKYINMWEPVNFVTKKDVEDIVRSIIKKK